MITEIKEAFARMEKVCIERKLSQSMIMSLFERWHLSCGNETTTHETIDWLSYNTTINCDAIHTLAVCFVELRADLWTLIKSKR